MKYPSNDAHFDRKETGTNTINVIATNQKLGGSGTGETAEVTVGAAIEIGGHRTGASVEDVEKERTDGKEELMSLNSNAPLGAEDGSPAPLESRMVAENSSGVPPGLMLPVSVRRNVREEPGINRCCASLKKLLSVRVNMDAISPLAPPVNILGPVRYPPPKPKSLRVTVLFALPIPLPSMN